MTRVLAGVWVASSFVYGFLAGVFHENPFMVAFYLVLLGVAVWNGAGIVVNSARHEGSIEELKREREQYGSYS